MAEYIEREATMREKLLEMFHEHNAKYVTFCDSCFKDSPEELNSKMIGLAEHLISNDVAPVVHGRWIKPTKIGHRSFNIPHCSVCDGVPCGVDENTKYCHNCGAKMDLEE